MRKFIDAMQRMASRDNDRVFDKQPDALFGAGAFDRTSYDAGRVQVSPDEPIEYPADPQMAHDLAAQWVDLEDRLKTASPEEKEALQDEKQTILAAVRANNVGNFLTYIIAHRRK